MKHSWAWIAITLIALESWYLGEQRKLLSPLRHELNQRPQPATANNQIATKATDPAAIQPGGPKPILSVDIGRDPKDFQSSPESVEVNRRRNAYRTGPEIAHAERAQKERLISLKYGLLFELLNLSAADRERVSQLLFNKANIKADIGAAIEATRPPGQKQDIVKDSDLFAKLLKRAEAEDLASMKDALGENGFALYLDYEANLARYSTVAALQQELASDPANSLSRDQTNALITLFNNDQTALVRLLLPVIDTSWAQSEVDGLRFAIVDPNTVQLVDNRRLETGYIPPEELLTEARFLNPAQIKALSNIIKRRTAGHALADDFWVKPSPRPRTGSQ